MAIIKPFRAWRYDPDVVGPLSTVLAPPYDVIEPEQQQRFYQRSPHNVIRLILGKNDPADNEKHNRYGLAAQTFRQWRASGVLRLDERPALYVYDQEFTLDGRPYRRRGFIARVLLEPFGAGSVFPHEHTMSGPKEDRLRLMRACRANFSQVLAIHSDPKGRISALLDGVCEDLPPAADFVDETENVRQVLRCLTDPKPIAEIAFLMHDLPLYIADGHHRYETALKVRDEIRRGGPIGDDPADYVSVDCLAVEQPGMVILPTHRLLKIRDLDAPDVLSRLGSDFEVTKATAQTPEPFREELALLKGKGAIGCYTGRQFHLLRPRSYAEVDRKHPERCESWRRLDVVALHTLILEKLFGVVFEGGKPPATLEFIQGIRPAQQRVDSGHAAAAFLLNPTSVQEVVAVAGAGDRMPPKSTYFFPKLVSGLVINPLE